MVLWSWDSRAISFFLKKNVSVSCGASALPPDFAVPDHSDSLGRHLQDQKVQGKKKMFTRVRSHWGSHPQDQSQDRNAGQQGEVCGVCLCFKKGQQTDQKAISTSFVFALPSSIPLSLIQHLFLFPPRFLSLWSFGLKRGWDQKDRNPKLPLCCTSVGILGSISHFNHLVFDFWSIACFSTDRISFLYCLFTCSGTNQSLYFPTHLQTCIRWASSRCYPQLQYRITQLENGMFFLSNQVQKESYPFQSTNPDQASSQPFWSPFRFLDGRQEWSDQLLGSISRVSSPLWLSISFSFFWQICYFWEPIQCLLISSMNLKRPWGRPRRPTEWTTSWEFFIVCLFRAVWRWMIIDDQDDGDELDSSL